MKENLIAMDDGWFGMKDRLQKHFIPWNPLISLLPVLQADSHERTSE